MPPSRRCALRAGAVYSDACAARTARRSTCDAQTAACVLYLVTPPVPRKASTLTRQRSCRRATADGQRLAYATKSDCKQYKDGASLPSRDNRTFGLHSTLDLLACKYGLVDSNNTAYGATAQDQLDLFNAQPGWDLPQDALEACASQLLHLVLSGVPCDKVWPFRDLVVRCVCA